METMLKEKPAVTPLVVATAQSIAPATHTSVAVLNVDDFDRSQVVPLLSDAEQKHVASIADRLTNFNFRDPNERRKRTGSIEAFGAPTQAKAAQVSKMLDRPMRHLAAAGEDGNPVANALIELKVNVDKINPQRFWLKSPGTWVAWIPFVGTRLNAYFTKFQSAGQIIESILDQLKAGVDQLRRDNDMLLDDQTRMRELTLELEKVLAMGFLLDKELEAKAGQLAEGSEERAFVDEEVRFPLRQRIQDLQAQLAVNQQGVLSLEVVRRNNLELIRGAKRSEAVTFTALKIAVQVALALADQKIVLKTIQAVDQTTNRLLAANAAALRSQGAEIHKMAAKQGLDMNVLRQSFADINAALDDLARFRREALPEMANQMRELSSLTGQTEEAIARMERGNQVRSDVIDLELVPQSK